ESKVDQCEVTIDNVTREMSAYIAQTEFVGRRLVIWKVFLEDLSDPENYVAIFDGYMDAPQINQYQMKVSVVSKLDTLGKRLPARSFEAKCPWQFGDENTCGLDVPEKNSTIESLSEDYMKIYDSNITGENDYWKFGEVETENQKRIITASGDGFIELDFPLPQEFETGESYNMVAGCDKGYDTSHGCKYWDNTQFYGGFRTIPKQNVRTG
ncbi:MAG: phage BR0599 family protein, partial [bacterium]